MYLLPRETQFGYGTRVQVLYKDVGCLEQACEYLLALGRLHIQLDGTLVAVELQVVEAIHARIVEKLGTRRVTEPHTLNLDNIGAKPRQHLCTRRTRLYLGPVNDFYTLQWCCHTIISLLLS